MTPDSLFRVAFWSLVAAVFAIRVLFARRVRRSGARLVPDRAAVAREGRGMVVARLLGFVLLVVLLGLYALRPPWFSALSFPLSDAARWSGYLLGLVSLILWTAAHVALGRQWSANLQLRDRHRLVTTGPYARIRHPIYVALLGYAAGLTLLAANWLFVLLPFAILAGLSRRVPKEEQMMLEQFCEEYAAYMRRTGRWFPR